MGEFGHSGFIGGGFCIDAWGAGPFIIRAGKTLWRFEDSDRFGPCVVTKTGRETKQPGEGSRFWPAYSAWRKQGRRLEEDRVTCIHDPLKPTLFQRVGRKNIIIQHGDDGGEHIEVFEAFDD